MLSRSDSSRRHVASSTDQTSSEAAMETTKMTSMTVLTVSLQFVCGIKLTVMNIKERILYPAFIEINFTLIPNTHRSNCTVHTVSVILGKTW